MTEEGERTDGVPDDSSGTIREPGTTDIQPDDRETTGELPGKSKKPGTSTSGSSRGNDTGLDRVPRQPVNYHITEADKLGFGSATTKAFYGRPTFFQYPSISGLILRNSSKYPFPSLTVSKNSMIINCFWNLV